MRKTLQLRALSHDLFWAMPKANAEFLVAQLGLIDAGVHDAQVAEAVEARAGSVDGSDNKPYEMYGSVALIYMTGAMTRAGSSFGDGSTVEMRRLIRKAVADSDVKSILLIWNSPGGTVDGLEELADEISAACKKKPVKSYFTTCCSAAMWCAAQADEVFCSKTAYGGSIGVFSYAVDMSKYAEDQGIVVTLYSTGKYKGSGVPGVPISEEQHAENQRIVEVYGAHFRQAISKGRDMSLDAVEEIADGRCWIGTELVSIGLVDAVASLDDVLLSMNAPGRSKTKLAADNSLVVEASDESAPIAGVQLRTALKSALTAGVEAIEAMDVATTRAAEVLDLRKDQGRAYSPQTLAMVAELASLAQDVAMQAAELLQGCEALGHDAPAAQTAPAETTNEEAALRESLALALSRRIAS